jgi:hypothetical protein
MNKSRLAAALALGLLCAAALAAEPLPPGYKVDERLQLLLHEYRVSGPGVDKPGEGCYLVCTYSTRPVVMVYTREITPAVVRLVKRLDEATRKHQKERLGSYVVLVCDSHDRAKDLKALAEREKIRHTLLSLVVVNKARPAGKALQARFPPEAATTVILATAQRQVTACHAYRKGEIKDSDLARILGELPRILAKKE